MPWDGAGGGNGAPQPFVNDEAHGTDEADAGGLHLRVVRGPLHFETNQVISDEQAPELLRHRSGTFASNRFFAVEHLGFDLVIAELDLPALVIQRSDFFGRKLLRIQQRCQERLWLETLSL